MSIRDILLETKRLSDQWTSASELVDIANKFKRDFEEHQQLLRRASEMAALSAAKTMVEVFSMRGVREAMEEASARHKKMLNEIAGTCVRPAEALKAIELPRRYDYSRILAVPSFKALPRYTAEPVKPKVIPMKAKYLDDPIPKRRIGFR